MPSNSFIGQLRESHLALIDQIDQIHQQVHHYIQVKSKLRQLQTILLNHFEKQKKDFYQNLKKCLESDREKVKLIEFLETDMKDLKIKTLSFFDAHPGDLGDVRPKQIVQDFEQFSQDIIGRIHHEKKYLIPFLEICPSL